MTRDEMLDKIVELILSLPIEVSDRLKTGGYTPESARLKAEDVLNLLEDTGMLPPEFKDYE